MYFHPLVGLPEERDQLSDLYSIIIAIFKGATIRKTNFIEVS